ncbi:MAG: pyruvate, water dikinase [Deltaproteobacteria bacterium]|nr:pyruvate, water dikinase [Deltaproteobacteria bacterium]
MTFLNRLYRRITGEPKRKPQSDVEALRIAFKTRYNAFKRLLASNRKAMDIMADIELRLAADHPFGMSFVRGSATGVSVNVLKMIRLLAELSPGKFPGLKPRFEEINNQIQGLMTSRKRPSDTRLIVDFQDMDAAAADVVGNKMAHLIEIKNHLDLPTPEGFIITAAAYERLVHANDLQAEIDRRCQSADTAHMDRLHALSSELQQLIIRSRVPDEIREAVINAHADLLRRRGPATTVALRSSAMGEDSEGTAFAGQYRSVLNVGANSLLDAYKEVLASKYTLQAMAYRLNLGIRDEDVSMSVGCLEMVNAFCGGVVYSRSPVSVEDDSIFINAAWGLPKSVVDGSGGFDAIVVSRRPSLSILRMEPGHKTHKLVSFPEEGLRRVKLPDRLADNLSLTPEQALQLAEIAMEIESYYQAPQDVEWAITAEGAVFILQCRPLQQMQMAPSAPLPSAFTSGGNALFSGTGVTASCGVAGGTVFQVNKNMDMLQFPQGAVLVTRQALPAWAPLLNRAAAVITETGGFAGHLANVAREFGVPALFGVSGAMDRLANGRLVTVDADRRSIYPGKPEVMPDRPGKNPSRIVSSPVYTTLQKISRLIVPLSLLDPSAPEFTPDNCKSLHDITRFVHEKSVHEMFNFGKSHHFSERSGKQLHYNVPMQWWILNLDDGFVHEVHGKYVKLENICSIPMLAFWEGYTAVAWDGPPPVDGKGLMSVMFRSTMNPALSTGVKSNYAERNYFMISKNFCSLNSRLGYHFSIMEALVGDRITENYVSFQFKGGAADQGRRYRRVAFIGDILEEHHFRVEIKEDHLAARVEGDTRSFMIERLNILGYLALHTRQLDMIMANGATVEHYRNKIHRDLEKIIHGT